jgi:shikimate dehydrogenase
LLYKRGVPETGQSFISAKTRYCAVFGHPVRHSASPAMHNAALETLGLDWRYLAFDVEPEHLETALEGALRMGFIGLNLTVPHKLAALRWVTELDEEARFWGAVNTIRFESKNPAGEWCSVGTLAPEQIGPVRAKGFNTDADAVVRAIQQDLSLELRGLRVVLLGAGGAGRVAAIKLASAGVSHLHLINRTKQNAVQVALEIQQKFPEVAVFTDYADDRADLVVNATSLGLQPADPSPLDERLCPLTRVGAVFDLIYRPAETPLLARARAAGCRVANGLGMLLYQGAAALELWTGKSAPLAVMRAALNRNIYGDVRC